MRRTMRWIAALLPVACRGAADLPADRSAVLELGKLTAPPAVRAVEGSAPDGASRAVFFDALPWKGKPTRVFAWLGVPAGREGRAPGIVLVHGGGGTAFREWVEKWTARGFAAISIAVEGQTDARGPRGPETTATGWKRHEWAGPARDGIYGDSEAPLRDQWMYHAVADTVLANSLLRSMPEVDPDKVGLMGVSWGGVITSTVIGIDPRFAFAIPTYGCGHLADAGNHYGRALGANALYLGVWDPMVRMARARMPVLWLSWPEDRHFPLDAQASCYRAAPGPHMVALLPGLRHGHPPAWNAPESYAFAEAVVRSGRPWCVQRSAAVAGRAVRVVFESAKPLDGAVLVSTTGSGFTGDRTWAESAASLARGDGGWIVTAPVPAGTTAWFVNVRSGGLTASSDYREEK